MSERVRDLVARVSAAQRSAEPGDAQLRERLPARTSLAALEQEIASEIAHSLGRAGNKLEAALRQAQATLSALQTAPPNTVERRQLTARFHEERTVAQGRLRDLMIQREALGFRRHNELLRLYPIPPRLPEE
jgi:hypothetical protein